MSYRLGSMSYRPDDTKWPWAGRLTFDPNVSGDSPCVAGTWITARRVVALILDGWTWPEILCSHPELTAGGIRACLEYTIAEDGADADDREGPDPPHPRRLP